MSRPPLRRLTLALLLSVLLHLLAGGGIPWPLPARVEQPPPPIEAVLQAPPPRAAAAATPPPVHREAPAAPPRPTAAPPDLARPVEPPAPMAEAQPTEPPPASPAATPPPPAEPPAAPAPTPGPAAAALPELPRAFDIRFVVQGNEGGFVLGRLDHVWRSQDGTYSIVGVAKASGIMGLIYSGLLSQTSDGRITPMGLRPDNYWMQRGRRQFTAHFDWERRQARLGTPYPALSVPEGTQDFLSVVYQLAFYPRPEGILTVVDGKTLKEYRYQELGRETLDLPLGRIETLHVQVLTPPPEEGIELWLRSDAPHLPVKIHILGSRQGSAVLLAEEIKGLSETPSGN